MAQEKLKEIRNINYLSKDFDAIKTDLIAFTKQNFPNDFQDFNEASGGMAILELIAYLGDLFSFYVDRQANETFITRALEEKNIIGLSKTLGRKPRLATPAVVNISLSAVIDAATSASSLFTVRKGTKVQTVINPSQSFEIIEDIDFSVTANRTISEQNSGLITASISSISAVAGESRTFTYTAGAAIPFLRLTLPNLDITEITSISSNDGFAWHIVDNLAQDTIFLGEDNTTSTSGNTPFVLKAKRISRRATIEPEVGGAINIRFGGGTEKNLEDSEIIPNPSDFILPPTLRGSASGFSAPTINAAQFLKTRSLGLTPSNVGIDITYRFGGGLETNVGSNTLEYLRNVDISYNAINFLSVSAAIAENIERSLTVTNPLPASGGANRESNTEIRENAAGFFSAQQRAVTLLDYQMISLSMPSKFGTIFRSYAKADKSNNLGVELLTVSQNSDGQLIAAGSVLKNNIESFIARYKSFSDSVRISDGNIINIGIDFTILPEPSVNANEALLIAFFMLKKEFDISRTNFNDFIILPEIISKVQSINQIRSVPTFKITNITGSKDGRSYSDTEFNVNANTRKGIVQFPEDAIWEIKFNNFDIIGRTV